MARRNLFTVTTPLGYRVALSRNRWREIVRFKHPALKGKEDEVRRCLLTPELIRASAKDESTHLYYVSAGTVFLCVVVAGGEVDEHFVVTAYFTKDIKKGPSLWTK